MFQRVAAADKMAAALEEKNWDVVLADYVMPGFSGIEALEMFKQTGLECPFILVSGHIGEEIAVQAMKAGAHEYVSKDRLIHLVPAIERALEDAAVRQARRRADEALRHSEERFRQMAENMDAAFFIFERSAEDSLGKLLYASPACEKIWGMTPDVFGWDSQFLLKAIHHADRKRVLETMPRLLAGEFASEFRIIRMDLKVRWIQFRTFPVRNEKGEAFRLAALAEDITTRKNTETHLANYSVHLQRTVEELQVAREALYTRNNELLEAQSELERRVEERTADLRATNAELQEQITERKRLEHELLEIAENERRRIGFGLHDDIGQQLTGLAMLAKGLAENLASKQSAEAADARELEVLLQEIVRRTENLTDCFTVSDLEVQSLPQLLRGLIANVEKTFRIQCLFSAKGALPGLSSETTVQFYKIAQEAVGIAVQHCKATRVSIHLVARAGQLRLTIKSNGGPFRMADDKPGNPLGIRIMQYRAHAIGAALVLGANGREGCCITCSAPVLPGAASKPEAASRWAEHPGGNLFGPVQV